MSHGNLRLMISVVLHEYELVWSAMFFLFFYFQLFFLAFRDSFRKFRRFSFRFVNLFLTH